MLIYYSHSFFTQERERSGGIRLDADYYTDIHIMSDIIICVIVLEATISRRALLLYTYETYYEILFILMRYMFIFFFSFRYYFTTLPYLIRRIVAI